MIQPEIDPELKDLLATADVLTEDDVWTDGGGGSEHDGRDWLEMDAARPAQAAALGRPVLAVSGDLDWQVGTDETTLWKHQGVGQSEILDGLTHAFNKVSNPDLATLTSEQIGTEVHPSIADAVVSFLDEQMS